MGPLRWIFNPANIRDQWVGGGIEKSEIRGSQSRPSTLISPPDIFQFFLKVRQEYRGQVTTRKPINAVLDLGDICRRVARRQAFALLNHDPPRMTFLNPEGGPSGSDNGEVG